MALLTRTIHGIANVSPALIVRFHSLDSGSLVATRNRTVLIALVNCLRNVAQRALNLSLVRKLIAIKKKNYYQATVVGIGGTRFISFEDRHWHNDCFTCGICKSSLVGKGFISDEEEDIICPDCAKAKLMSS